eukprot:TRINITY_DN18868_c0_g1_i1.p1 TRINITY_DN18868_c0_g1~~TRINITY_DN18868_c0_g1_i1.p1  ORF type:complete len:284 (+),score=69.72 TRINITY_DN18868_c0_g1_i1:98-949(+)
MPGGATEAAADGLSGACAVSPHSAAASPPTSPAECVLCGGAPPAPALEGDPAAVALSDGEGDAPLTRPLGAAELGALPEPQLTESLGEELFRRVSLAHPATVAAKVTGMLLKEGASGLLPLLDNEQALSCKVQEAIAVLTVYEKACEVEEVKRTGREERENAEADRERLRGEVERLQRELQASELRRSEAERELSRRTDFPLRVDTLSSAELRALDEMAGEYHALVRRERHDRRLCKVCMDAESAVVLLPCKHQVLCAPCGRRVDRCPICMQDVADRFEPFQE